MPHRMLRVLMDYTQLERKPYLGGFRNKRTNATYHHAGTQASGMRTRMPQRRTRRTLAPGSGWGSPALVHRVRTPPARARRGTRLKPLVACRAPQTPRAPKFSEADRKLSRETQTVKVKVHSQQTVREAGTQMARPGLLPDDAYDR